MRSNSKWMGNLLSPESAFANKPINSLIIPGSHDSGTTGMDWRARTQSLNIREQLIRGARYFDCRVKVEGDTYYFHHTLRSDNILGTKNDDPIHNKNQNYALTHLKDFLHLNPNEIVILKFQNFLNFGEQDYEDFLNLIIKYLEPDSSSNCKLVTPSKYVDQNGKTDFSQMTIKSLNADKNRVFLFFQVEDVPTDPTIATAIWDKVFKYEPTLSKDDSYDLWDPYWGDDSNLSVNDTDLNHMQKWWDWHWNNLQTWSNKGFFVLQSHMQELHASGNGSGEDMYYNIAEKVADGNYYLLQESDTGDYIANNTRNIQHYLAWYKNRQPINIVTFDYVQLGGVCDAIVDFYMNPSPTVKVLHYQSLINLKLNALTRFIGALELSNGYAYPKVVETPVSLKLLNADDNSSIQAIMDGDTILICTTENNIVDKNNELSVYKTDSLYYYNGNSDHEQWVIRNGNPGSNIRSGDFVWFENQSYTGQFLTFSGDYLTTQSMSLPTRWIIS